MRADGGYLTGSHLDNKRAKSGLNNSSADSDSVEEEKKEDEEECIASLKVLRWKFIQHKINRAVGIYSHMEDQEKLDLSNRVYSCFL